MWFFFSVGGCIPKWETCKRLHAAAPPIWLSGALLISMATAVPARRRVSLLQLCETKHADQLDKLLWKYNKISTDGVMFN